MGKDYHNYSKTYKTPRRPFEKERLDREMKLIGEFGLKNKKEVYRVQYALAKLRSVARQLLTLPPKHPKRIFEGEAILTRLTRLGVLSESQQRLDYVLGIQVEDMLQRRLQTRVFQAGLAKSIHHARTLIFGRHIRVGKRMVNVPSFNVRTESEKHIELSHRSPFGGGRPGRVKRKTIRNKGDGDEDAEEDL